MPTTLDEKGEEIRGAYRYSFILDARLSTIIGIVDEFLLGKEKKRKLFTRICVRGNLIRPTDMMSSSGW
jgi:hypothetical protein